MERLDCVELSVAVNKNFGCGQALSPVQGEAKPGGRLRGRRRGLAGVVIDMFKLPSPEVSIGQASIKTSRQEFKVLVSQLVFLSLRDALPDQHIIIIIVQFTNPLCGATRWLLDHYLISLGGNGWSIERFRQTLSSDFYELTLRL